MARAEQNVYFRFNGEMEVPVTKYPWQYQSCSQYIYSFRHIAVLCKKYSPAIKLVWGPSGYPGAEQYWPGNNYVDLISVDLSTMQEFSGDPYPAYTSLQEMIRRKLFRMRFMDKSVLMLGSSSIKKSMIDQSIAGQLNAVLEKDRAIYRTPVIPLETDSASGQRKRTTNLVIGVYDPLLKLDEAANCRNRTYFYRYDKCGKWIVQKKF